MQPQIKLIYAQAHQRVIGFKGDMPWGRSLPEDLAHFKATTLGQAVIMGRKTWESLPPAFRPLPNRRNIVLSRDPDFQAEGAQVQRSLEDALQTLQSEAQDSVWVIGGAQIYTEALPLAHEVIVTEIDASFQSDAFAPELVPQEWYAEAGEWHTGQSGLRYRFVRYTRNTNSVGN